MKSDAVIVSAGKGLRFMEGIKKPFYSLAGKPILAHTLEPFEACPLIRSILLVVGQEDRAYCIKEVVEKYKFKKVLQVVPGGKQRQDSSKNGVEALPKDTDIVVIHDGVRPFVTRTMIEDSIHAAAEYGAAVFAVPVKDTIKQANPEGFVLKTLERKALWQIQTPQTFQVKLIKEAFYKAAKDKFSGTDDASLVERLGKKVRILPGSYTNIKMTTPEDLTLANLYLNQPSSNRKTSPGRKKTR